MPSKKPASRNTSSLRTTSISGDKLPQFVSCELSDDEKASLKKALLSPEEIVDLLETMQNEGYRIAVSHDVRSDCVGIYVTATDPDHENHGLALSARAPDTTGAFTVIAFKHYTKLGEDWRSGGTSGSRDTWG